MFGVYGTISALLAPQDRLLLRCVQHYGSTYSVVADQWHFRAVGPCFVCYRQELVRRLVRLFRTPNGVDNPIASGELLQA